MSFETYYLPASLATPFEAIKPHSQTLFDEGPHWKKKHTHTQTNIYLLMPQFGLYIMFYKGYQQSVFQILKQPKTIENTAPCTPLDLRTLLSGQVT